MKKLPLIILLVWACSSLCLAQNTESYGDGYEAIVNDLTRSRINYAPGYDPFQNVRIHLGVGYSNNIFRIPRKQGRSLQIAQSGFQFNLGIDLFSKSWVAEGGIKNFGKEKHENMDVTLREFDLKVVYKYFMGNNFHLKMGAGVAGRYLTIEQAVSTNSTSEQTPTEEVSATATGTTQIESQQYTTPSTLIMLGVGTEISNRLSLSIDVAGRMAMITDTIDENSLDFTIRIDGHF